MHISTQGLVLREVNYKESDKLLTVLTAEGGKRTVKARGCRRKGSPLAAAAQLLVYSDMTLFEYRDYFTLNEAESLQQFWRVRSDLERLSLASYFAEVMEAVAVEGRPDPMALSLILNSLYALDRLNRPLALVKAAFELKLMCLEGYEPLLDACAVCGAPEPEAPLFHLHEGVLCCASCRAEERRRERGQASHSARYPMTKRINRISTGLNVRSSTLVDMKVVPHIRMVTNAARWPAAVRL